MGFETERSSNLRVLLVQSEFFSWRRARHWSYTWHLGIEEGLQANGVEFLTLTTPWISDARSICTGRKFDQVWINDIAHFGDLDSGYIDESTLKWLASLAPVTLGFLAESVEYSPEEYSAFPNLLKRRQEIELRLKYFTHFVACDEKDLTNISTLVQKPAIWSPIAIPKRFTFEPVVKSPTQNAIFSGALYGERLKYLEHPDLRNLVSHQSSPENHTIYPILFDALPNHRLFRKLKIRFLPKFIYPAYLQLLRRIRRQSFKMYLKSLRESCAVVNLPSLGKVYTSRVFEGMAAGRPVIAWEIPNRPMTKALFENGKETLLYSTPTQLANHIQQVSSDPAFGKWIAENARRKLRRFHTIEKRVQQILNWIETGETPKYV